MARQQSGTESGHLQNLNVNQDEQRSKTEDENDDEDDLGRKEASRKRHTVKNRRFLKVLALPGLLGSKTGPDTREEVTSALSLLIGPCQARADRLLWRWSSKHFFLSKRRPLN
jgi:hypothetical protein